jgi:hypothetical protein
MYCFMNNPEGCEALSAIDHIIDIKADPVTQQPRSFSYVPRDATGVCRPAEYEFSHFGFTEEGLMAVFFSPTRATLDTYTALRRTQVFMLPDLFPPTPNLVH